MAEQTLETYDCSVTLPYWRLHLAQMQFYRWRDLGNVMDVATSGAYAELKRNHPDGRAESGEVVSLIHKEIRDLGLDPDARPPSSELLINEILEKETFPRGCLPWEFLAVLTIKSQAPWSVVNRSDFSPPLIFREGKSGESLPTPTGIVDCGGLPVLADANHVLASPFVAASRYDLEGCEEPLFVCFLPESLFRLVQPKAHVGRVVWLTWAYKFLFEKTCSYEAPA